jgi:hypothetical protein
MPGFALLRRGFFVVGSRSRRRGLSTTLLASSAIVFAVLLSAAPAAAATTPFNTNLVKNGGAENGVNNWQNFPPSTFKAKSYGPAGYGNPPKSEGNRIGGGAHYFSGGIYNNAYGTCPYAKQDINLTGIGNQIDSGHVKVVLKAYAATNGAAELAAHVDLTFFDAEHHNDGFPTTGIRKSAKSTNETYRALQGSKVLPNHTRILQVYLYSTPYDGSYGCQSAWDKVSVQIQHV